ncbi:DNA endonuclease RBBP8 [Brachyistius frenatus]|uniref:DNA endonuclease RBBP8 n=1 Tax=Brachyistius frenatus TaxID=100188 RepID=UPI0037E98F30
MSSSGMSSGTTPPPDVFQDLWRQLGECHQNALQELEAKVSKLKKDRCLDAQRLEVFYNRNQQLKEQNKTLQDAISLLEERLRTGECDRCAILEENLKNNQDQNLHLVAKLKNERNRLEDEIRKLHAELQKLKMSRSEDSSPEQDESIIPDSPVMSSSLPVVNKLKKRKNVDKTKHVRYAEMPLSLLNNSLFNVLNKEHVGATKNPGRAEVLVPNTCELDASQISNHVNDNMEAAIAETCALELLNKHRTKTEMVSSQRSSSKTSWKKDLRLNPDLTAQKSPSLLPCVKRFSEDSFACKTKRKKQEGGDPGEREGNTQGSREGKHTRPEQMNHNTSFERNQSFKKEPADIEEPSAQTGTSSQKPNVPCISLAFKKPDRKVKLDADGVGKKRSPLQDLSASHRQHEAKDADRKHTAEPMWSIDPALAVSMYDSKWRRDEEMEEQQRPGELTDTDCTWVSHSLLQGRGEPGRDRRDGLGQKANDSLDMMFDATAYGDYKSYNSSHLGQSQLCDDDDDEEEEEEDDEPHDPENTPRQRKAGQPTFAHVAVIRKKDERRKLKGTSCKECEIYYAHLPEEEKQKKMSACSRHRFLYIPPSTPENFWEVGFPSTLTCIERGYIKEDMNPEARSRRRRPLNALFSPKGTQEES